MEDVSEKKVDPCERHKTDRARFNRLMCRVLSGGQLADDDKKFISGYRPQRASLDAYQTAISRVL